MEKNYNEKNGNARLKSLSFSFYILINATNKNDSNEILLLIITIKKIIVAVTVTAKKKKKNKINVKPNYALHTRCLKSALVSSCGALTRRCFSAFEAPCALVVVVAPDIPFQYLRCNDENC